MLLGDARILAAACPAGYVALSPEEAAVCEMGKVVVEERRAAARSVSYGGGSMVRKRAIKIWMLKKGLRVQDVAASLGVHHSYVYHFLAGKKKALVIRNWFLGQGCPAKYLGEGKKEAA